MTCYGISGTEVFMEGDYSFSDASDRSLSSYVKDEATTPSVEEVMRWVTLDEFSNRKSLSLPEVKIMAASGKLGETKIDDSGVEYILWHREEKRPEPEDHPPLGMGVYVVRQELQIQKSITISFSDKDSAAEAKLSLVALLKKLGPPENVYRSAVEELNKSCFVMIWTQFEIFLGGYVDEIFKRHPEKMMSDRRFRDLTINFQALLVATNGLSSIDKLREYLVDRILSDARSQSRSIASIIDTLKSIVKFTDDPYRAQYICRGVKREVKRSYLDDLRIMRNSIVHSDGADLGSLSGELFEIDENKLIITDEIYHESVLVIRSFAASLNKSIVNGKYRL
ncbi:hypothetical protein GCM10008959_32660 [Deinococcus seoulensis]|uniref:Apea-like HEPN domain-containing protein n=2 Tax=Deinococcus seoulensis TaxID=1837379 RepID=A0ABQ2RUR1_9DEIO|nr:hypothetical protein GCM10008959_32660 [Deinococcus seoulensis]